MDRLQKKCFLASGGFHLLLLVILIVGPAFVASRSKPDDLPPLTFIPTITTDAHVSGGGDPHATPPPPLPPANPTPPTPTVEQHPPAQELQHHEERQPDPPKDDPKPVDKKPDPESLEPVKEPKRHKPDITTTAITKPKENDAEKKARDEAKQEEQREAAEARDYAKKVADWQRRRAAALGGAANSIADNVSSSTTIKLAGPGGGGPAYANFLQAVKTVYEREWIVPDGVTDNEATAAASVTIARDGTVISAHLINSSGNVAVDQSVNVTLRRVKFVAPLPQDSGDNQRTVTVNFNVAAKRAAG